MKKIVDNISFYGFYIFLLMATGGLYKALMYNTLPLPITVYSAIALTFFVGYMAFIWVRVKLNIKRLRQNEV